MGDPRPKKKPPARRPRATGASMPAARRPRVSDVRPVRSRRTADAPPAAPATPAEDVVLVHGKTEDGALKVLRKKGDELSAGELRPVEEGKPLRGNLLRLRPREDLPFVADVEEEIALSALPTTAGPAKVATPSYRKGWDGIWGKRRRSDPTLN